jgi:Flp pilus assembly protein TadG
MGYHTYRRNMSKVPFAPRTPAHTLDIRGTIVHAHDRLPVRGGNRGIMTDRQSDELELNLESPDACVPVASESVSRRPAYGKRKRTRGQTLVEFALLLPVMVLILALAADFGRAFTAYIAISGAAREGAAYGMQSTTAAADSAGMTAAALADAPTIWGKAPVVTAKTGANDGMGYPYAEVTVDYNFEPIIAIPPLNRTLDMTRTVRMRVIN